MIPAAQHDVAAGHGWRMFRMTCTHEGFHSGQGRYDRRAGALRYVMVCDDCLAEIAQICVEAYTPSYRPEGGFAQAEPQPAASGVGLPSAANSAS
jgi:hypothetical protein